MKDGRFCSQCLGFFPEASGHVVGDLFFCGLADNSVCAFVHFKQRGAVLARRTQYLHSVRYDVCQRGPKKLWYVRVDDEVDYGCYARDEALRIAYSAAMSDFRRGYDAGVWIRDEDVADRVF